MENHHLSFLDAATGAKTIPGFELLWPQRIDLVEELAIDAQPALRWRSWFTDQVFAALADHLPEWRLEVAPNADGWRISERGLALTALPAFALSEAARRFPPETMHHRARDARDAAAVRRRNPQRMAALAQVEKALRAAEAKHSRDDSLPPLSTVLREAGVGYEVLSPWFGQVPTPEEIDRLGRYLPSRTNTGAARFPSPYGPMFVIPTWTVEVEPGWRALLYRHSPPLLTSCPLPTTPQPGDTPPAKKPKPPRPPAPIPSPRPADDF
jgi:hypothetical protein